MLLIRQSWDFSGLLKYRGAGGHVFCTHWAPAGWPSLCERQWGLRNRNSAVLGTYTEVDFWRSTSTDSPHARTILCRECFCLTNTETPQSKVMAPWLLGLVIKKQELPGSGQLRMLTGSAASGRRDGIVPGPYLILRVKLYEGLAKSQ